MVNTPLLNWLLQMRTIDWKLKLGFQSQEIAWGSFRTSLSRLNIQGDYWGHTYIKAVGDHYEDYSLGTLTGKKLLGTLVIPPPASGAIVRLDYKTAAPNVTGLIGEVLVATFFRRVLRLGIDRLAHIGESINKSPDFCTSVTPQEWAGLLVQQVRAGTASAKAPAHAATLAAQNWGNEPIPVEIKTRLTGTQKPLASAFHQLKAYWDAYPNTTGIGHYFEVDLPRGRTSNSTINVHLFALNSGQTPATVAAQLNALTQYAPMKAYLKGGVLLGTP